MTTTHSAPAVRAVCASDALHLFDLVAGALPYEPAEYPTVWEQAAYQAIRTAWHALQLRGWLSDYDHALADEMQAFLFGEERPLADAVRLARRGAHALAFMHELDGRDRHRLSVVRQFLNHYDGAMRRDRK